jgi:peptidoglycan/LPS O-acetylase OafA/YrhL
VTAPGPSGPRAQAPAGAAYRPELQGLRALAVTLVVVYHVWIDRVSGGVDVFFLLTGFLLTGGLMRAAERGALDVRLQWSRTLRRLIPAAAVVLAATAVLSIAVLPQGRWTQTIREIAAAALFVENWQLAADSVDYAARTNMTSVVQHFWSLSIQGQVFLLWPLLVAVVAVSCAGSPARLRPRMTAVLASLFVASLAYSVELTITNQPLAYFHTLTRLWEFALGGLLALTIDRIALSPRARVAAGWLGVVGLVACGAAIPVADVFPGVAALWPTGCAALVLVAGRTGSRAGADRLLAGGAARYVGDLSYSLYLWHWVVLVGYLAVTGEQTVGPGGGATVILTSLGLAVLTHHLVERPVLRRPADVRSGYRIAASGTAAVLLVAVTWQVVGVRAPEPDAMVGDAAHPGATALRTGAVESAPLLPPPVSIYDDWVRIEHWDCTSMAAFPMNMCTLPTIEPPARRVVLVGDSHIQQLSGAVVPIAQQSNWQLTTIIRGACPFSTASEVVPDEPDCLAWNAAAMEEILAMHPDTVITLASRDARAGLTEQTPSGFVEQWRRLDAAGIAVVALRDTPRFTHSVPDCVQTRPDDLGSCGIDRADVYTPAPPWTRLSDVPSNVTFIDIADAVCDPERCPAAIGNVLVYMDDNHLSATYSTTMAGLLADPLHAAVER